MSIGSSLEVVSQRILVGIVLVGRLGVQSQMQMMEKDADADACADADGNPSFRKHMCSWRKTKVVLVKVDS